MYIIIILSCSACPHLSIFLHMTWNNSILFWLAAFGFRSRQRRPIRELCAGCGDIALRDVYSQSRARKGSSFIHWEKTYETLLRELLYDLLVLSWSFIGNFRKRNLWKTVRFQWTTIVVIENYVVALVGLGMDRTIPYFKNVIVPHSVSTGKNVLIASSE